MTNENKLVQLTDAGRQLERVNPDSISGCVLSILQKANKPLSVAEIACADRGLRGHGVFAGYVQPGIDQLVKEGYASYLSQDKSSQPVKAQGEAIAVKDAELEEDTKYHLAFTRAQLPIVLDEIINAGAAEEFTVSSSDGHSWCLDCPQDWREWMGCFTKKYLEDALAAREKPVGCHILLSFDQLRMVLRELVDGGMLGDFTISKSLVGDFWNVHYPIAQDGWMGHFTEDYLRQAVLELRSGSVRNSPLPSEEKEGEEHGHYTFTTPDGFGQVIREIARKHLDGEFAFRSVPEGDICCHRFTYPARHHDKLMEILNTPKPFEEKEWGKIEAKSAVPTSVLPGRYAVQHTFGERTIVTTFQTHAEMEEYYQAHVYSETEPAREEEHNPHVISVYEPSPGSHVQDAIREALRRQLAGLVFNDIWLRVRADSTPETLEQEYQQKIATRQKDPEGADVIVEWLPEVDDFSPRVRVRMRPQHGAAIRKALQNSRSINFGMDPQGFDRIDLLKGPTVALYIAGIPVHTDYREPKK